MAIARKALVWALFAAGGTVTAFVYPVLIALFLLASLGRVPPGLSFAGVQDLLGAWPMRLLLLGVIVLALWHAAHRMRVLCHDLGLRADRLLAWILYLAAGAGSLYALALLMGDIP